MTADAEEEKLNAHRQYKAIRDKLGRKPSSADFLRESGFTRNRLGLIYGRNAYSRLVTECGDQPTAFGRPKSDLRQILETWGKLARELGTLPFVTDWTHRRFEPRVAGIKASHGINWGQMPAEFLREFGADAEWQDVVAIIPSPSSEAKAKQSKSDSIPLFQSQFLPPAVADLVHLSLTEDKASEFERRVSLAFQMLGFEVKSLGQGTGRNPDAVAKATQERFGLIVDAKARNESYLMGTEDRKFIEYIQQHEPVLTKQGYEKLYFVIVSSRFTGRDLSSIRRVKQETQIPVIEIRADQLLRILAFAVENPLLYDRTKFERLLLQEGELAESTINKIFKKE